ncbi:MAG: HEAT repeat domain-containing protein [Candidatus Brocadiia bacterium]
MPAPAELKALIDQMPDHEKNGLLPKDIDKERIEKAIAQIAEGGRPYVLGILDRLLPPGKGDDSKPHYALHVLGVHLSQLEDDAPRRQFGQALASRLGDDTPVGVRKYLCQELGTAGGAEAVPALGKLLTDSELCEPAARALVAIREGAAQQLRAARPRTRARNRVTIVQNLGVLADEQALEALREALGDSSQDVRIAAAWALANIGDADSADRLLKAADTHKGWERIQETKACLLLAEKLLGADRKADAQRIYKHLRDTRTADAEKYVREAAEAALAAI